ncbi:MAG TPA: amidohydrolase [Bradyrhizobium sp.]|nr:amidohydrolase [Bradyrhizobium sp.]
MGVQTADTILTGNVLVLDRAGSTAEAVAIVDGRILLAGRRDKVVELRGPDTKVHDFGSNTLIPGFNDTHAHSDSLGLKTIRPSLEGAKSIADILGRIRKLAAARKPGEWVVTMPIGEPPYYWEADKSLAEGRLPNRGDLDSVAPDNPVYISSPSGYWGEPPCFMILNSLALKLNGIDRTTTPRVDGVEIVHDASGEPTGLIIERNYTRMAEPDLLPAVPRFTLEDRIEGLRRSLPMYQDKGTTSVYEGHGCAPDVVSSFRSLWENGELTLRSSLVMSPAWLGTAEAEYAMRHWLSFARGRGFGDDWLKISGVFVGYGGNPQFNDLLRKDMGDTGWGGGLPSVNTPSDFEELCMLAGKYNLRLHTLASDRLHEVVPILERVAKHYPIGERRWVIEHISKASERDLRAIKAMGVAVTLIPAHYLWKVGHTFAGLDDQQLDLLSPARGLTELGVPVSAATDAVPNDPLFCMWVMLARKDRRSGKVMGANGALTNETALRLLTVNGAWLTFEEDRKGPLLPGYFADIAVLSGNPLNVSAEGLLDIRCQATMVGGRWVHGIAS